MDFPNLNIDELVQGYHQSGPQMQCNYCSATFTDAAQMAAHLETIHDGALTALLTADTKYNTLTDNQSKLLQAFSRKQKDQTIADQLEVSASTIRHQKFTFREKAKQARFYLAQYQAVFGVQSTEDYLPIPPMAADNDDRFRITETEYAKTTQKYFEFTDGGLVLTRLPKGQKKSSPCSIVSVMNSPSIPSMRNPMLMQNSKPSTSTTASSSATSSTTAFLPALLTIVPTGAFFKGVNHHDRP